jgi:serine/threonine-protein kinase
MCLFAFDRSDERVELAKTSIDRAIEIGPDQPEIHVALGWYNYQCTRDYDQALKEFEMVREGFPSDPTSYMGIAVILRQLGDWEASAKNWSQAVSLDPLGARICYEYGYTLYGLRRYNEAERLFDRALKLNPDWYSIYTDKSWIHVLRDGDITAARQVVDEALQTHDRWSDLNMTEIKLDILARDYELALERVSEPGDITECYGDSVAYYRLKGNIYYYLQRENEMRACFDSARSILERRIANDPGSPYDLSALGFVYARLGRIEEALEKSKEAVEKVPMKKSTITGSLFLENMAMVNVLAGKGDRAIDQLEILLSNPCDISVQYLKLWPDYDPLRDQPRFRALIAKYEREYGT